MNNHSKPKSHKKLLIGGLIFVAFMFGFGYALVPLYNVICSKLGINGKPAMYSINNDQHIDKTRIITVEFLSSTNANLPWTFQSDTKKIKIHPGENAKLAFYAKNNSDHTMTVQAIPSISPGLAALHLKKTQCFCFTQQTLNAHQAMKMPLIFYLDDTLPKDIQEITLSYTLFEAKHPIKNKVPGQLG